MRVMTALSLAGTALQAGSSIYKGTAAKSSADDTAAQLFDNADQIEAQGTRDAYQEARKGQRLAGDARAAQAAGGGSASDAGAVEQISGIQANQDYNVLSMLFDSRRRAGGVRRQANAKRTEGRMARNAGLMEGITTAISGGSKVFESYKANKPKKEVKAGNGYGVYG